MSASAKKRKTQKHEKIEGNSLNIDTNSYDPGLLSQALNKVTTSEVQIEGGVLTYQQEDETKVRSLLATFGIDVHNENIEAQLYEMAEKKLKLSGNFQAILAKTEENASWTILADGNPIAKINLNDQDNNTALATVFCTSDYGDNIIASFTQKGVAITLSKLKAEVYTDKKIKPRIEANLADVENLAISRYQHCFALALKAADKNVIENPLKSAIVGSLVTHNVANPDSVAESLYTDAVSDFINTVNAKAEHFMSMSQDSLTASEEFLNEMSIQAKSFVSTDELDTGNAYKRILTESNVNLQIPTENKVTASQGSENVGNNLRAELENIMRPKF